MIDLRGKVAVISGAARGIGRAIAETFAANGAAVVLGDILVEEGEATARAIRDSGGKALFVPHDVAIEAQWEEVVATALSRFGGLDVLVNNAAFEQMGFLADLEYEAIQKMLTVNVTGTILGHKHAIRAMRPDGKAGKGGSIVNLSSVAGLVGTPGLGLYTATKGAVRLLSKAAANECGRLGYGIRVNSVHPGFVDTAMGSKLLQDFVDLGIFPDFPTAQVQMLGAHPIGRTGVPRDIANAILFLASDLSNWVTGTEIVVDGGMTSC